MLECAYGRPDAGHHAVLTDQRRRGAERAAVGLRDKHDGFRFICRRDGDRVRVFSRRGIDHGDRTRVIAEALLALKVRSVTHRRRGRGLWS